MRNLKEEDVNRRMMKYRITSKRFPDKVEIINESGLQRMRQLGVASKYNIEEIKEVKKPKEVKEAEKNLENGDSN